MVPINIFVTIDKRPTFVIKGRLEKLIEGSTRIIFDEPVDVKNGETMSFNYEEIE